MNKINERLSIINSLEENVIMASVNYSIYIKVLNSDYSGIAGRRKKKAIAEAIIHSVFSFSNFIFYISINYQHNQY